MNRDEIQTDSDDATLQKMESDFQNAANNKQGLDWDYLHQQLNIGPPPGTPPIATKFKPKEVQYEPSLRRLKILLDTPIGEGMLVIYRGTFQDDPPPEGSTYRIYVGVIIAAEAAFDILPIAGHISGDSFAVSGVHLIVTSDNMTPDECSCFYGWEMGVKPTSELAGTDYSKPPLPPLTGVYSRLVFKAGVRIVTAEIPLLLEFPPPVIPPTEDGADRKPLSSIVLNTRIGPITFERVFIVYDESDMNFGLGVDLSMEHETFKLKVQEVTAAYSTEVAGGASPFKVKGVEIAGELDGVTVGGGLYVQHLDPLTFWGELAVNLSQTFGFAVMTAYAHPDNQPSLFGFGFVEVPIGGPPFLEISGIAAGGAYNRDLIIPQVEDLNQFPFIQAAMSFANPEKYKNPFPTDPTTPTELINTLEVLGTTTAPPKDGRYWATLGVAFTSCKVATGFVLLSAVVGSATRISVVGELLVTLPPRAPGADDVDPFVLIDSFLRLVVDISVGEIALDAYIRHNSYLLESRAKLTGGIAIRSWFKGDHNGEFIVSAGGYAPGIDMTPYPYYPVVPRLACSIVLANGVQIQGRMYLTVSSSLLMFGLAFQVSGKWGPAEVWAVIGFDSLIRWHPVHYDLRIAVSFGASFKIKVWFVHITITVHISASLAIWGPSFAALARLDLSICTISLRLGANTSQALPPPLTWSEFKDKYLAAAKTDPGLTPDAQDKLVSTIQLDSARTTILSRKHDSDSQWIVDPETLVIYTHSQIPGKHWTATILGRSLQQGDGQNSDFGVHPCDFTSAEVSTSHSVTIEGPDGVNFSITTRTENMPSAQWGGEAQLQPIGPGALVQNALVGLELRPIHSAPDRTLPALLSNLLDKIIALDLVYLEPSTDHSSGFTGETVSGTIGSSVAAGNRGRLLAALENYRRPGEVPDVTAANADVSGFANGHDADLFINPPRMRLLGEDRV